MDQPDSVKQEAVEDSLTPGPSTEMETALTIKNEAGTLGGPQMAEGSPSPAQAQMNPTSPMTVGQPPTPGMPVQQGMPQPDMLPVRPVMSAPQPGMPNQPVLPGQAQARMMMPQQRPQMTLQQAQQMGIQQQNVLNTQTGMIEPRMEIETIRE